MPDPGPTLSLCMIVRDAETSLGRALASARPFMDEIVVVDTGSRDATKRIAVEHGARVFDFPWCDSFAAARNHSIDRATGDWVFWMDADDVLPASSGQELRRLVRACPNRDAAFWVMIEEAKPAKNGAVPRTTAHGHVKLFPRRDDIRFRYRIHEQIAPVINKVGLPIRTSRAVVRHVTDRSAAAQAARRERNLRLALLDEKDYPNDPFVLLSLGITHLHLPGALPKATDYLRRSADACPRGAQIQLSVFLYLGQALGMAGLRSEEEQLYREALSLFKDDAVLLTRLGRLCESSGRMAEAMTFYRTVLVRGRVRTSAVRLTDNHIRIAQRLGQLYIRQGQRFRAEQLWRDFLKRHPRATAIEQALKASYLKTVSFVVRRS
jgi:glycosyltransferase involved in cell wall biosynthesis